MLSKAQINNFLKLRVSDKPLDNIKNIIILTMIKYYKDMNIITFIDNIDIKYSKRNIKAITEYKKDHYVISTNNKNSILNQIEYIFCEINYLYNNKTNNKEVLRDVINILQVEDMMKVLFKLIRLNNIAYFDNLSMIDGKTYRCYIKQVETNLFMPIYLFYKRSNKELVKHTEEFMAWLQNDFDDEWLNDITKLYDEAAINWDDIVLVSENYRKIKDIVTNMLKVLKNK